MIGLYMGGGFALMPAPGGGFLNDDDPPLWVKAVATPAAARYDEPSARDARRRIVAFFDRDLEG